MFFNYDSFEIGAIAFVLSGIFIHYFYNSKSALPNESLVNTNSSLNSVSKLDSNIQLDNLPNLEYIDVSVQTETNIQVEASVQAANTYINTGMQTSSRMWLESIRNWITEILSSPTQAGNYVDVGVQVDISKSTWQTVKQWFLEVLSVRSSELSSMGYRKIDKWRNNLDDIQSVDLHDSESPLTIIRFGTDSPLQQLIEPNDSASNISEVISNVEVSNRVYDITDPEVLKDLLDDSTVYSYYDHTDHINYVISDVLLSVYPSIVNLII
jgi:hypothetical protein